MARIYAAGLNHRRHTVRRPDPPLKSTRRLVLTDNFNETLALIAPERHGDRRGDVVAFTVALECEAMLLRYEARRLYGAESRVLLEELQACRSQPPMR